MHVSEYQRGRRYLAGLVLTAALCVGQTEPQQLADQARQLQPEFAADILFRLLAQGKIKEPQARRETLEDLYNLAARAQNPVPLDDVISWTDTSSWSTGRAFGLHLDALSIRCRVVKDMLGADPQRARQMFLDIALPPLDRPGCESAVVADVSIYYDTARTLADQGLVSLENVVRTLSSALQLPAAARAIRTVRGSLEERQLLLDLYARRLNDLTDSDRAASFALGPLQLAQELTKLAEEDKLQGMPPDGLLVSYRKFLAAQAAGERCGDSTLATALDSFNERLRWGGYLAAQDLPRLSAEEMKPSSSGHRAKAGRYWRTDQSKHLLSAIRHLRFGDGAKPLAALQKSREDWQAEAKTLLDNLELWKADQEPSAADAFHERAILYGSLLDLMPPGALRETAAASAMNFLAGSSMKASNPLEWLLELDVLLDLKNSQATWKAALTSKDPSIMLYGSLTYQK